MSMVAWWHANTAAGTRIQTWREGVAGKDMSEHRANTHEWSMYDGARCVLAAQNVFRIHEGRHSPYDTPATYLHLRPELA
jgi:hypothetical protein